MLHSIVTIEKAKVDPIIIIIIIIIIVSAMESGVENTNTLGESKSRRNDYPYPIALNLKKST